MRYILVVLTLALLLSHWLNAPSRERAKMLDEIDAAEEELRRNTEPLVHHEIGRSIES